jgi:DNA polymerase
VRLYPIFHPAAALYTPAMLDTLRADFTRLPELLTGVPAAPPPPPPIPREAPVAAAAPEPEYAQLGLF